MTDRYLMVEQIQNAMMTLDLAHEAKDVLVKEKNPEALMDFREWMLKLADELEGLKNILAHESEFSLDEISELLSQTMHEPHVYRRIPPAEMTGAKK